MAKRKRKMTLFDVMHTGHSVGLQVRMRVPSYQPVPELPVTKKLAKLFGRTQRKPDPNRPQSAADELETLRRELAGKSAPAAHASSAPTVEILDSSVEADSSECASGRPFIASAFHGADREDVEPVSPAAPGRSFRDVVRDRWALASPKLEAMTIRLRSASGRAAQHAGTGIHHARELFSAHAVTAIAAIGVVVLLCGSFYAGKMLFNRPASSLTNGEASQFADNNVRPDVLDITSTHSNEPMANVDSGLTQTKLERNPQAGPSAQTAVFGGRRADQNYVIVQSYFSQAEADATVDVLAKYGLKTSVELNLPRWAMPGKNLYSVVSSDGFAKMTGNAAYQSFIGEVAKISDKEAGNTLPKKLDPRPYKLQPQSTTP